MASHALYTNGALIVFGIGIISLDRGKRNTHTSAKLRASVLWPQIMGSARTTITKTLRLFGDPVRGAASSVFLDTVTVMFSIKDGFSGR